jgi:hypothetical protein
MNDPIVLSPEETSALVALLERAGDGTSGDARIAREIAGRLRLVETGESLLLVRLPVRLARDARCTEPVARAAQTLVARLERTKRDAGALVVSDLVDRFVREWGAEEGGDRG